MNQKKQQYGLFTAISMIVGIAIGAGVFFKTDEILNRTGGNVALGVLVFCIGAFSIIFGSLSVAELAIRSNKSGGAIGYYEEFISPKTAAGFGWFQLLIYLPALGSVVSYFGGNYICSFLGIESTFENKTIISLMIIFACFFLNIISAKFGSYFQNATTVIKLIPLVVLTFAGFILSGSKPEIPAGVEAIHPWNVGFGWIAALTPIAFTYDGWIITTSITNDVKNPKKTMPRALTIGPIIVLTAYVMYFVGINKMLGPEYIMSVKNKAVGEAGKFVFGGEYGDKVLLAFIIISALGVVNGIILGLLRMPCTLQSKKMFPGKPQSETNFKSCVVPLAAFVFWTIVNYIFCKFQILGGNGSDVSSDVSSIAVVFGYLFYFLLYVKVIKLHKEGKIKSTVKGLVYPILAMLGALVIIVGGFMSDPIYAISFSGFSFVVFLIGAKYLKKSISKN